MPVDSPSVTKYAHRSKGILTFGKRKTLWWEAVPLATAERRLLATLAEGKSRAETRDALGWGNGYFNNRLMAVRRKLGAWTFPDLAKAWLAVCEEEFRRQYPKLAHLRRTEGAKHLIEWRDETQRQVLRKVARDKLERSLASEKEHKGRFNERVRARRNATALQPPDTSNAVPPGPALHDNPVEPGAGPASELRPDAG